MRILILLLILLTPALVVYLWWKLYNTPNGERYLKMRMQGLYVPTGKDDRRNDEARHGHTPEA